jgi:hypothetical protein
MFILLFGFTSVGSAAEDDKVKSRKRNRFSCRRLISTAIPADSPPINQGAGKRKIRKL